MSLKPLQSHINAVSSLYAPYTASGGGGNVGPDLAVSSLAIGAYDGKYSGIVMNGQSLFFDDESQYPFGPYIKWLGDISTLVFNTFPGTSLNFGTQFAGANSLNITDTTVTTSSLTVSSINGTAPGGGVNPFGISTNQIAAASGNTLTLRTDITNTSIVLASDKGGGVEVIAGGGLGNFRVVANSTITSGDLYTNTLTASTIRNKGFPMPVFQTGVSNLDAGGSTIIETDYIFAITDPVPQVTYRGSIGPGVSSLGAQSLSPSTFIVYGFPNAAFNWLAAGS